MLPSPELGSELMSSQVKNDDQLIELWLHGRPATTQRAYRSDIAKLLQNVDKKLQVITLGDLQSFIDSLTGKPSSIRRAANAVKSLMAFGFKLGYLRFDVGRVLRLQPSRDELAERILTETDVLRILASENNPRNRSILLTFYGGGFRVSEIASLKWRHLQERDSSGQITVYGKGGKTRSVLVPAEVWNSLLRLRGDYPWETVIPYVNPISYSMMGLLPQMHRDEMTIAQTVQRLIEYRFGVRYELNNVPNEYLKHS